MTVDANRVSLLPCPLCNCGMMLDRFVDWEGQPLANQVIIHPSPSECPLVDTQIDATPEAIAAWNRRSPSLSGGEVEVVAWIATETPDGVPDVTLRPDTAEAWRADGFIVTPIVTISSHQSALAAKDAEIAELREQLRVSDLEGEQAFALAVDDPGRNPPVTWKSRAEAAEARANAAVELLAKSADAMEKAQGWLEAEFSDADFDANSNIASIDADLHVTAYDARAFLSTLNGAKP